MTEKQIIARLVELFRSPALDNDDSPESAEFDRLESQLVSASGGYRAFWIASWLVLANYKEKPQWQDA
jgi:hypothetical protein